MDEPGIFALKMTAGYFCTAVLLGIGIHFRSKASKCRNVLNDIEEQNQAYSVSDLRREHDQAIDGCKMEGKQYRLLSGNLIRKQNTNKQDTEKEMKHLRKRLKYSQDNKTKLIKAKCYQLTSGD